MEFTLRSVEWLNLTLGAGAVAASLAFLSPLFAVSVASGAAMEAVSFRSFYRQSQHFFELSQGGASRGAGLFGFRFVLLVAGIAGALAIGAHPVGLLVGLSLLVPSVVIAAWRTRPALIPAEPGPAVPADDPSWDRWSVWRGEAIPRGADDDDDEDDA